MISMHLLLACAKPFYQSYGIQWTIRLEAKAAKGQGGQELILILILIIILIFILLLILILWLSLHVVCYSIYVNSEHVQKQKIKKTNHTTIHTHVYYC